MTDESNPVSPELADPESDVFLQGAYGYRSWRNVIMVGGIGVIGGTVVFLSIRSFSRLRRLSDFFDNNVWGAVVGIGFFTFGVVLCYLTVSVLWKILTNIQTTFRIDAEGIRDGKREWKWEQITFIDAVSSGIAPGLILRIGVKRHFDRGICSGMLFREHEYEALLNRLSPFLEKNYPEVRIG